mmetsp:Transcript_44646/g.83696  ORF Transcript_44646/g.83696 Transcript_44646/m.83696 type:complete len:203 (-) Transcript_44646:316-924(-)
MAAAACMPSAVPSDDKTWRRTDKTCSCLAWALSAIQRASSTSLRRLASASFNAARRLSTSSATSVSRSFTSSHCEQGAFFSAWSLCSACLRSAASAASNEASSSPRSLRRRTSASASSASLSKSSTCRRKLRFEEFSWASLSSASTSSCNLLASARLRDKSCSRLWASVRSPFASMLPRASAAAANAEASSTRIKGTVTPGA